LVSCQVGGDRLCALGSANATVIARGQGMLTGDAFGSVIATVVPDGFTRGVVEFASGRNPLTLTVRDNVAVGRRAGSPGAKKRVDDARRVTWYAADGRVIARFDLAPAPVFPA
jgi:hypothetical protein